MQLRMCSSRALSRLRALFHVGAWCSDPGIHVLSFGFVSGFGHSCSCPVLHMAGDLFAGHVLVFLFCVSTWLLS